MPNRRLSPVLLGCALALATSVAGCNTLAQDTWLTPRSIAAARGQSPPPATPPAAPASEPAEEPLTIEQVRAQCWNKVDNDRRGPRDLDRRLALVKKCVDERLGPQSPS